MMMPLHNLLKQQVPTSSSTQATSPRTSASLISDSIQTPKTANDDATAVPLPNLLKQHVQELQLY